MPAAVVYAFAVADGLTPVLGDLEVFFDGGRSNRDGREIERFRRGRFDSFLSGCLLRRFG